MELQTVGISLKASVKVKILTVSLTVVKIFNPYIDELRVTAEDSVPFQRKFCGVPDFCAFFHTAQHEMIALRILGVSFDRSFIHIQLGSCQKLCMIAVGVPIATCPTSDGKFLMLSKTYPCLNIIRMLCHCAVQLGIAIQDLSFDSKTNEGRRVILSGLFFGFIRDLDRAIRRWFII